MKVEAITDLDRPWRRFGQMKSSIRNTNGATALLEATTADRSDLAGRSSFLRRKERQRFPPLLDRFDALFVGTPYQHDAVGHNGFTTNLAKDCGRVRQFEESKEAVP